MAKKTKIQIQEVIALNQELNLIQKESGISFLIKYDLSKILDKTKDIVKRFNDSRTEIFKKYGKSTDEKKQSYTISGCEKEQEALDEIKALLEKEEIFERTLKLKDFENLNTEVPYIQLMKLFDD